ncbi:MAG: hypothetical protein NWF04_06270 [Candidatus Bathyarchaeota archaeon]|nr:hypothetical protein [Candidatus Bathyarchaeota archaeon]
MNKHLVLMLFTGVWAALLLLSVTWGFQSNMPDNVHTDYGLPLTYATHTTSTIAGAANLWTVSTTNLAANLIIWIVALICGQTLLYIKLKM